MYFYNKLEPKLICESAIKYLKNEQNRIQKELNELDKQSEDWIQAYYRKIELNQFYWDYSRTINGLEKVEQFVTEKMFESLKSND